MPLGGDAVEYIRKGPNGNIQSSPQNEPTASITEDGSAHGETYAATGHPTAPPSGIAASSGAAAMDTRQG